MTLNWKAAQAPYVARPQFLSYGAFEEKRPVLVDCSLGVNPLTDIHPAEITPRPTAVYGRYPAGGAHGNAALAAYITGRWPGVPSEAICFGAGSQGTISSLSRILGGPSVSVLGFMPQFIPALLEFATVGAKVTTTPLVAPDFRLDVDALAAQITIDTTLVYVDNTNNHTGKALPLKDMERLAAACAAKGALLLVDEAYSDFVNDAESALNLRAENLICCRSFSKGCGLAGLRTGYIVINDPELRRCYQELGLHFSCSVAGADMAGQLLPDLDLPAMRRRMVALKRRTLDFIAAYPAFRVAPTHEAVPIFFLQGPQGQDLYNALMEVGIQTEPGFFFGLEGNASVRVRTPSPQDFDTFCRQWEKAFGKA